VPLPIVAPMDDGSPGCDQGSLPTPGPGDDLAELARDLARWAGEARQQEAAATRSRRRWLEQQAAEEATFVAVLLAFGEGRVPVVLGVTSGNPVRGLVAAVGRDFCAVRTVERGTVLVRLEDITDARVRPGHSAVIGTQGGGAPTDMALADVLFGMAGERPEVVISLRRGGGQLSGELRTVGVDVASLRTRSDPPATIYVPMDAVSQVSFRP